MLGRILPLLILAAALNNVHLYYHIDGVLHVDSEEVRITYEGEQYSLYDGTVSPRGTYVSGLLLDSAMTEHLAARRAGGIIDYFAFSFSNTFVICLLETGETLHARVDIPQFPGPFVFSPDERYLYIANAVELRDQLLSILDGRVKAELDYDIEAVKWIGSVFFFVSHENGLQPDSLCLRRYRPDRDTVETIFRVSASAERLGWPEFAIVDSSTMVIAYPVDSTLKEVAVVRPSGVQPITRFPSISDIYPTDSAILIVGMTEIPTRIEDWRGHSLYEVSLDGSEITELFSALDVAHYLGRTIPLPIMGFRDIFCEGNCVYFVTEDVDPDTERLMRFDRLRGEFSSVSSGGSVSAPVGIVHGRR